MADGPQTTRKRIAGAATRRGGTQLWPAHSTGRGKYLQPNGMTRLPGMTSEQIECVERIALDIFADMSNAGRPLRDALAAIYLSGAMHALDATKEAADAR